MQILTFDGHSVFLLTLYTIKTMINSIVRTTEVVSSTQVRLRTTMKAFLNIKVCLSAERTLSAKKVKYCLTLCMQKNRKKL